MSTLRELTENYQELLTMLEDEEVDNDTIQCLVDTIEAVEGEFELKAENYFTIIERLKMYIQEIKEEEKRLSTRKKHFENRVKFMTDNLMLSMKITGKTKFQTSLHSFSISKVGGLAPLKIDCKVDELPENLVKTAKTPDNEAIRKYIQDTGDTSFAHLEPRGETLRVR
jgi:hypothetical protein